MSKQRNALRFPSGRAKWVVASRHALARKIITSTSGDWVKIDPSEEGAAASLVNWGMIERHQQTPAYARWSVLHERPVFGRACHSTAVYGVRVSHLSPEQSMLLTIVEQATRKGGAHEVLAGGHSRMQTSLRALERRGLIDIERGPKVWRLTIARAWRDAVLAGTSTANVT